MNKKFSTLIASLLFSGMFSVATTAYATDEVPYRTQDTNSAMFNVVGFNDYAVKAIEGGKWYQLQVGTAITGPNYDVLIQERDYQTGELYLKVVPVMEAPLTSSLWSIEVVGKTPGAYLYEFTNKETGYTLSYNCDDAAATVGINKSGVSAWRWYTSDVATTTFGASKLYAFNHDGEKVFGLRKITTGANSGKVAFVEAKASEVTNGSNTVENFSIESLTVRNAGALVLTADDINSMIDADGSWENRPSVGLSAFEEAAEFKGNDLFKGQYKAYNTSVVALKNESGANTAGTPAGYSIILEKDAKEGAKKYLMVATDKTYESDQLPSNHGGLVVEDAVYDATSIYVSGSAARNYTLFDTNISAYKARFHWKVTYYPTPDSLVFEPLNASMIGSADKQANRTWKDTDLKDAVYKDFYNTVNQTLGHINGAVSTVPNYPVMGQFTMTSAPEGKAALVPVALTLMNKSDDIDKDAVLTIGQPKKAVESRHATLMLGRPVITNNPAEMGLKIGFAHEYTSLKRSSVEDGVYFIQISVDPSQKTDYRKEGMYLVYNMEGRLMYDMPDDYQDYEDMPATQWVVVRDTCDRVEDGTPYVSIYNREYYVSMAKKVSKGMRLFYGQLYSAGEDENGNELLYIINHDYNVKSDTDGKFPLKGMDFIMSCGDTIYFTPVKDATKEDPYLGYKRFEPENLKYETFAMKYLNTTVLGAPNTDNFLSIDKDSKYLSINANSWLDFELEILTEDEEFGFASEQAGAVQLKRTTYALKVRDDNLIDNQWRYVVVKDDANGNPYYQMAHLKDVDGKNVKLGTFYFKADQVTTDNPETAETAYVLVDATGWSAVAEPKKEGWVADATKADELNKANPDEMAPYVGRLFKENGFKRLDVKDQTAKVSFMTLNTAPMDRTSAFIFTNEERPLYKTIQEGTVEIYRERGAGFEFLFNDGHNATGLTEGEYDKSTTYVGITAEGVQPAEGETTEMYVHKVLASNPRMPKYLFFLNEPDSVKDGRWCTTNTHGYFPSEATADEEDASHHVFYNGYLAGKVMVNFNDSITDGHDMLMNARKYGYRNYVRLGFVEAIHMNITEEAAEGENAFGIPAGEYLFVFKGTTIADVTSKWDVVDPALLKEAIVDLKVDPIELTAAHQDVAFSLRLTELTADEDGKDVDEVLLESKGIKEEGSIGTFSDASWVQILNGVPVLAQKYHVNGDHTEIDGTSSLSQLVNQAQMFRLDGEATIPTSNEEVEVNGITVYSAEGAVIVKGATGVATITNVLGQVVSKTTITSDYETIAAPAGVVFVTVNGETVKVLVK